MHRREGGLICAGARVVLISAVVGMLVLPQHVLASSAALWELPGPAKRPLVADAERAAALLRDDRPLSGAERATLAERRLRSSRRRRIAGTAGAASELVWRVATSASPRRVYSGLRRLYGELRTWGELSYEEAVVLGELESDVRAGLAAPRTEALRAQLQHEPVWTRVLRSPRIEGIETLDDRLIARGREFVTRDASVPVDLGGPIPSSVREEPSLDGSPGAPLEARAGHGHTIPAWEAQMSLALLVEDYARVVDDGPPFPTAELAQAAALHLSGRREEAIRSLRQLRKETGETGAIARSWLEVPEIDPGAALLREQRAYRVRRTLGWIGGASLEERGLEFSRKGLRSWWDSFSALNLVVSVPLRVATGRRPEGEHLRRAAERYVVAFPEGRHATAATHWLETTRVSSWDRRHDETWDDGRLSLPPARTPYARVVGVPLLVDRDLITKLPDPARDALRAQLSGGDAVLLTATPIGLAGAMPIDGSRARAVLGHLALAVEQGKAVPRRESRGDALEAIRRMDNALGAGSVLHAQTWSVEEGPIVGHTFVGVLAEGEATEIRSTRLQRDDDSLHASRAIVGKAGECPQPAVCLERARALQSIATAQIDVEGNVSLEARADLGDAALALRVEGFGPSASVVLPLSRWLGFSRWLPLEAHVGIGVDGLSLGPRFPEPRAESYHTSTPELEAIALRN